MFRFCCESDFYLLDRLVNALSLLLFYFSRWNQFNFVFFGETMNNGVAEAAVAPEGGPQPLEWRFSQVFGERAAGEEVQEGALFGFIIFDLS